MGDENPIRTLGDYSKPSHEGYRYTIELPVGSNMVPLRSDTIRLVQNECSFYGLRSEDPNQHLKDFLKLVDSLELDGKNRERTSDNDSDDEEVLNELSEYENARTLRRERIINSFDGDDLAFECMIGFRKFTAYLDPFLLMNIISCKAYNTIMVDRLEGTGKNLVAIVRDVYVSVRNFTYIMDFVVLEDIGEFIMSDMAEVLMRRPFRKITKLKYDVAKGLVSFTKIFDTYTYRMPRTIPRLKNFNWSKVPPLLELSQNDLMNGFRQPYEKYKFMYKNCLNIGPKYQVNESMKEWLIHGH
ncbi:hypothetical protein Tco_1573635, partial [Tanacetum coccineum]